MIPRGTKVKRELEFFTWEGWVIGDVQTRGGTRMCVVEIDKEATWGSPPSREVEIFCVTPDKLIVVDGVRYLDKPNSNNNKEVTIVASKY